MISNMGKVSRPGQTVPNMKDSMQRGKNMVKVPLHLQMVAYTEVTSNIMKFRARADMYGLMASPMKDNGIKIKCMDMEC